jgi:ACS family hexuronate transporter-like MFS transporter
MSDLNEIKVKIGNHRWIICALLFFATTVNYLDRTILGILAPTLQREIGWSTIEYGYITTIFQAAYAIGTICFGWFIDKYGTKIGYSISIIGWSAAAMATAAAKTVFGFGGARFFLGLSESGNFPAAIKAIAEWFPKKERALATGIFNSGANIGAIVAPAVVPWLAITYGWQAAFIMTGAVGFVWLIFWIIFYEKPDAAKKLTQAEKTYILSDLEDETPEKISWIKLLKYSQTWAFVIGKSLTDPIWWFYVNWMGMFFHHNFGYELTALGLPLIAIYTMSTVGSIGGGWLSGMMINRGMAIHKARKLAMLICAILVLPIMTAAHLPNVVLTVAIIGLAAAAHQGYSANILTTASDLFPKKAVASVTSLGTAIGSVCGMGFTTLCGYIVQTTDSYAIIFILSSSIYLIALGIVHLLTLDAKPVNFNTH